MESHRHKPCRRLGVVTCTVTASLLADCAWAQSTAHETVSISALIISIIASALIAAGITWLSIRRRSQAPSDIERDVTTTARLLLHIQQWHAQYQQPPYAMLLLRMPGLPTLIDSYGLRWGETMQHTVRTQLQSVLLPDHLLLEADKHQYLVLAANLDESGARQLAQRLEDSLQPAVNCCGINIELDIQFAIALSPEHGDRAEILLEHSAIALSQAGTGAAAAAAYATHQDDQLERRLTVTKHLQQAMRDNQLTLVYQPCFDLHRNRVTRVEALLRWTDPELGPISPEEFIPLAENSGDIIALSEWVIGHAASQAQQWHAQGIEIQVGINISGRHMLQAGYAEKLHTLVRENGAKANMLILEITESTVISDQSHAIDTLNTLRQAGFTLALDDFGNGYSSLAQLKQLPVDELKIDRSFVLNLDTDASNHKIVRAIVELGHNLGLDVVAAGVENHTSLQLLRQMDCDAIQGYHLSPALSAEAFGDWWSEHDSHVAHAIASGGWQETI